ncbi:4-amino-4-deoxy-L-arabinose-phosphoundecaprenol flippase subunit ArnE [bioreactor metagenome]|uniref:4-amino-4-deoxy-L-arabinose-phosphoundecaprenol flippase subunit ArnE n=1 Tax=bioreactor metagenome TaxID=1076179 RepID=A0A645IN29_9ZZZZ
MIYFLLAVNIILLVLGQTLWKIGLSGTTLELSFNGALRLLLNPYILGGLLIYGAATAIWLYILSKAQLSVVYPLQSLCYVAAAVIALVVFKENIPLTRWIGIAVIIFGAYLVSIK